MSDSTTLQLNITTNSAEAVRALNALEAVLRKVKSAVGRGLGLDKAASEVTNLKNAAQEADSAGTAEQLNKIADALERLSKYGGIKLPNLGKLKNVGAVTEAVSNPEAARNVAATSNALMKYSSALENVAKKTASSRYLSAIEDAGKTQAALPPIGLPAGKSSPLDDFKDYTVTDIGETASEFEDAANRINAAFESVGSDAVAPMESLKSSIEEAADAAGMTGSEMEHMQSEIESAAPRSDRLGEAIRGLVDRCRELSAASGPARHGVSGIVSAFGRIAFYRLIRTAIKEIAEGFKTGITNVREYSKAIGSEFNRAMDAANNATFKMKNSLGAALAPVLQSLVPLLQMVVSWVITAANAFNQFFAILGGATSWTRATDASAKSLDKVKASAGGAGKAIKNLLADWDELNVIQSQGGGGGGGGGGFLPIDYESMFEQVNEFDEKIKGIASWIRERIEELKTHGEELKTIAATIGATILTWRVSGFFAGFLSKLGWLAELGVITIQFELSYMLTNLYLETGNIGWLISDVLTTAFGTVIGTKILKALGVKSTWVAIPIHLAISAIAGISAVIGNKDVSALSRESIIATIEKAVEGGIATGVVLYKTSGLLMSEAIGAGAAGALLIAGASIGLKAVFDGEADLSEITPENAKAILLGAGLMGVGGGLMKKMYGGTIGQSVGTGIGTTIATGLALGAAVDLKAILSGNVDEEDITPTTVRAALLGAGSAASIGTTLAKNVFHASGADAVRAGVGSAIATGLFIGAAVGIKALTDDAVDMTEINEDTITRIVKNALMVGGGVLSLLGAVGVGTVGALAGGVVAAVATGLIIWAYVNTQVKLNQPGSVEWGDITLTQEQVQTYVSQNMFTVDVPVVASVITNKVVVTQQIRTEIKEKLTALLGTTNVIKLGVAKEQDYETMRTEVNDIVETVSGYAEEAKAAGKLVLQFTPRLVVTDQDVTGAEWFTSFTTGWDKVEEYVKGLGAKIGEQFVEGEKGEIIVKEPEVLETLMEQWTRITEAISSTKINAEVYSKGVLSLGDLSKASFEEVLHVYEQYKEELRQSYSEMVQEVYITQSELAAAYKEMYGEDSPQYKEAIASLRNMEGRLNEVVDEYVEEAAQRGKDMFFEWATKAGGKADIANEVAKFFGNGIGSYFSNYYQALANNIDLKSIDQVGTNFKNYLIEQMNATYGSEGAKFILEAQDLFGVVGWDLFSYEQKMQMLDGIAKQIGASDTIAMLKSIGIEVSDELAAGIQQAADGSIPEAVEEVKASMSVIDEANVPGMDMTEFETGLDTMVTDTENSVEAVISSLNKLNGIAISFGWSGFSAGGIVSVHPIAHEAEGGFPTTGEMFIAREAGPEMVGRIGNRSAVANNDQIVSGVASGVAAGQSEQNALLRQQNEYLRRILAKEGTVKVEPSSAWGKFNRRSEEMYARNAGV